MRCRSCNSEVLDGAPCRVCSSKAAKPRLVGALLEQRGETAGQVHGLRIGRNKLGRDAGCDIILHDARASGDHAYLFVGDDAGATLTDVSRNGTLVDGRVLQGGTAPVVHGTVVQVGGLRLTILRAPPVAP